MLAYVLWRYVRLGKRVSGDLKNHFRAKLCVCLNIYYLSRLCIATHFGLFCHTLLVSVLFSLYFTLSMLLHYCFSVPSAQIVAASAVTAVAAVNAAAVVVAAVVAVAVAAVPVTATF